MIGIRKRAPLGTSSPHLVLLRFRYCLNAKSLAALSDGAIDMISNSRNCSQRFTQLDVATRRKPRRTASLAIFAMCEARSNRHSSVRIDFDSRTNRSLYTTSCTDLRMSENPGLLRRDPDTDRTSTVEFAVERRLTGCRKDRSGSAATSWRSPALNHPLDHRSYVDTDYGFNDCRTPAPWKLWFLALG